MYLAQSELSAIAPQLGCLLGVVVVTIYFLKYLQSRDTREDKIIEEIRQLVENNTATVKHNSEILGMVREAIEHCRSREG